VSGWFQVGNLGGAGLGGGLGLLMLEHFPAPWMAGAVLGATFLLSGLALRALPDVPPHRPDGGLPAAFRDVAREIGEMGRSKAGLLTAVLFFLPLGTGAASAVLTQATVAAQWGAGAGTVSLMQGWISGIATSIGCLAAGRLQDPWGPRGTYAVYSVALGVSSVAMAISPFTPPMYVVWSVVYNLVLGLCYASFTSATLHAMGKGSAATKYNLYASLANFPIWWVGLLLAWVADHHGSAAMLHAEAALAAVGTTLFVLATRVVSRSRLPETVAAT
jgi:MFS family permease